ncbi:hypothetical protein ANCDUO_15800 [Ancylostoma duodenale]|uniref:Spermine/spermidine synthase n=1 Tax=Ancylostoma duodenale TaxID=51022 RepID=A0A0C2FZL1_9BILA|nr:hypothetical protein ANCDUO_15800 [Ancylostoma duodenale]
MTSKIKKPKSSQTSSTKSKSVSLNFLWGPAIAVFIAAYLFYHREYFLSNNPGEIQADSPAETFKKFLIEKIDPGNQFIHSVKTDGLCSQISHYSVYISMKKCAALIQRNASRYKMLSLKKKGEFTEDNWDMKNWRINKSILISGYGKVMVGFVFAMEGLKYASPDPQNVLMIGLGGGVMTNFLSTLHDAKLNITTVELDPTVRDVAVKWFELVENDEHTVIIGDGAKFITDEAKKGSKYNAIFLDACYTVCPAKVFLDSNVVADTARIVADDGKFLSGVLAINVLTEMDKRNEQSDHILNLYKARFKSCFLFYIRVQQVLLCSHRANYTLEEQTDHFMEKLKEVDENFEFNFTR